MPKYVVRVKASVTKNVHVTASSEAHASERAYELFTLECEGPDERYEQDVLSITKVS